MTSPSSIRPENTDQLTGANADLNLRWTQRPVEFICNEAAHILFAGIVCPFWRIRLWIAKSLFLNTYIFSYVRLNMSENPVNI